MAEDGRPSERGHWPVKPVLQINDLGDYVLASLGGASCGVAWGPAADRSREWFVRPALGAEAYRVADKEAAIAELRKAHR